MWGHERHSGGGNGGVKSDGKKSDIYSRELPGTSTRAVLSEEKRDDCKKRCGGSEEALHLKDVPLGGAVADGGPQSLTLEDGHSVLPPVRPDAGEPTGPGGPSQVWVCGLCRHHGGGGQSQ